MAGIETETRREQIYSVASVLFSARGYNATSVRDIARELDLQGGSLYAHIASKEDLLWEIITRVAASFNERVAPLGESDGLVTERLRAMIHAHVAVVVGHLSHATVFFQDWRHLNEPRRSEVLQLRDEYEALFRRVIRDGIASGEFQERDPRLAAMIVLTALNGVATWFRVGGELTADEVADEMAEVVLRGLGHSRVYQLTERLMR